MGGNESVGREGKLKERKVRRTRGKVRIRK